ncbi:MAG: hypothetical protein QW407_06965, partial [Thermofilaceae archaeon]
MRRPPPGSRGAALYAGPYARRRPPFWMGAPHEWERSPGPAVKGCAPRGLEAQFCGFKPVFLPSSSLPVGS